MNNEERFAELIQEKNMLAAFKFAIDCAADKTSRSERAVWLVEAEKMVINETVNLGPTGEFIVSMNNAYRGNFNPIYELIAKMTPAPTLLSNPNPERERFDQIVAKTTMGLFHIEHVDKVSIKKDRLSLADEWLEWIIYFGAFRIGRHVHVQQMLDFNGDFSEVLVEEFRKEVTRLMPVQSRVHSLATGREVKNES